MWLITPIGFFSIVQKSTDVASNTLTIRARVKGDLEALKATVLPGLGGITESKSTDYRYRAVAPKPQVEAAMAKLVATLDYGNFKNQVAKMQGSKRAKLYHDVWDVLSRMQGDLSYALATAAAPVAKASAVPKADAYGGVLFDAQGRTLLREPAGHFGGYVWTFAKGKPDSGETPDQTALREVREETGYTCRIVGALDQAFVGDTSTTAFFLMRPVGEPVPAGDETAQLRWAGPDEARSLIQQSTSEVGRARDLDVLNAAQQAISQLQGR
jgi:8-oxo-dGTP pyrophosphatase MutT (NUDIX family)